jgi:1,4-alpha-glucan branching enzyme
VIAKIPYVVTLGINLLQPLPIDGMETDPSMGYSGADLFSPDFPYVVIDAVALKGHLVTINGLLAAKKGSMLTLADITPGPKRRAILVETKNSCFETPDKRLVPIFFDDQRARRR